MCSCTGCEYTDKFAAPHFIAGQDGAQACAYPKNYGFEMWPRGNPSGRKAATEYSAHASHGKRWHNGSKGAEFSADELRISAEPRYPSWLWVSGGLPQPDAVTRRYLAWGNAEAQKQTPAAKPALARPAALSKAPQHFPAPDRSSGEAKQTVAAKPVPRLVALARSIRAEHEATQRIYRAIRKAA